VKIDGASLPYPDQVMDVSFTVTVLQHNTDEKTFKRLVQELARVTKTMIVIMEDIGEGQSATGEWILRSVDLYRSLFAECGYRLSDVKFLNTKISRSWCQSIHDRFVSPRHLEGETISPAIKSLMGLSIAITSRLDELLVEENNLAKMIFLRR
jgi:hypothetical protein